MPSPLTDPIRWRLRAQAGHLEMAVPARPTGRDVRRSPATGHSMVVRRDDAQRGGGPRAPESAGVSTINRLSDGLAVLSRRIKTNVPAAFFFQFESSAAPPHLHAQADQAVAQLVAVMLEVALHADCHDPGQVRGKLGLVLGIRPPALEDGQSLEAA